MANEEKVLVFSPAKFILKWIFALGAAIYFALSSSSDNSLLYKIAMGGVMFVLFYFVASLFGFSLRATGNYIVAAVLFIILFVLLVFAESYIMGLGKAAQLIGGIVIVAGLIWLPINDIRKAVLYIKNTV